jgi:hypothetical protein
MEEPAVTNADIIENQAEIKGNGNLKRKHDGDGASDEENDFLGFDLGEEFCEWKMKSEDNLVIFLQPSKTTASTLSRTLKRFAPIHHQTKQRRAEVKPRLFDMQPTFSIRLSNFHLSMAGSVNL